MPLIHPAQKAQIDTLRVEHLASLPHFQEYFQEYLVGMAQPFLIEEGGRIIGYCYSMDDGTLVEFHLQPEAIPEADAVFDSVIEELSIQHIYCKTFDPLLLCCCLTKGYHYEVDGLLFRDLLVAPSFPLNELTVRYATPDDTPMLLEQPDGLYEDKEDLVRSVDGNTVLMYFDD